MELQLLYLVLSHLGRKIVNTVKAIVFLKLNVFACYAHSGH